ncbi:copper chaperone PCu(A)C [Nocardia goodfellowii]|uniref:Copper(I)-binding protein n=1 Tax=Nocardia goodfellowii TaxID=882446 RepID=A0ABS4QHP5_9NOCA|nr:copper chaperone PCu(A)C [Nocardia goodfellowii]MBP2191221.1 copper(I)-binding protein [Nocardia goodfellowii]
MSVPTSLTRLTRGVLALGAVPLLLAACSSDDTATAQPAAEQVSITDQWVKAAPSGMSAAFGTLTNDSAQPVTVVAGSSPVSSSVELHEIVTKADGTKVMQPKPGGFTLAPHASLTLRPGADHIMFMGLHQALRTGSDTSITLVFGDGSSKTFTAQVRDFPGNQEEYGTGGEHGAQPTPAPGA